MILRGDFVVIHDLHKQGYSMRAIARMLKIDRKTVRRALNETEYSSTKRNSIVESKLAPYKDYITNFINKSSERIPYTVILEDIAALGYQGSRSILQHFLTKVYKDRRVNNDPVVRFETAPGMQMQVDWTTIRSGKKPIYAFVAILGYSRHTFTYFVDNMEVSTLVTCHEKALLFFGGVTKTILYDNMKAVVIERDRYGKDKHKLNDKLYDFSKKCGFEIRLCRPYRAKTKGKVERVINYIKGNFYRPIVIKLQDSALEVTPQVLNARVGKWLIKANNRVHGTTKKVPSVLWQEEIQYLIPYAQKSDSKSPKRKKELPVVVVHKTNLKQYDQLIGALA